MISKLRPRSDFSHNVLTLMTGTTIAQAIPIAISPILTRIYTPEDFGVLAIFISITAILASVVNGRYELAIGLPESDDDAINIAALGMLIAAIVSIVCLIMVIVFNPVITGLLNKPELSTWLYWVPLSMFLVGFFNVLTYLNNRAKKFKDIATANIYKSAAQAFFQILLGLFSLGSLGLITGQIASQLAANTRLCKNILNGTNLRNIISLSQMISLAKRYISFPKYSMWAGLFNAISNNIANLMISTLFSASTLGLYYLVQKVLGAPITIISSAIGQVFLQEATIERRENNHAKTSFNMTIKKLFLIGLPLFITLFLSLEYLFGVFFGEQWKEAGKYAAILTPLYFVRFIVSPVSMMNVIFEKNHVGFYWQMALMALSIGILIISSLMKLSFINFLYIFTTLVSLHYLLLLAIISTYNNLDQKKT